MKPTDLTAAIHATPSRGVLAVTGGGSGAIGQLLTTPGASATVLEAIVPYAPAALTDWLGKPPNRACDPAAARAIAMRAWRRAHELDADANPLELFGLGCTASLASTRPKRGEHRAHLAVQTAGRTLCVSLHFEKGQRTRGEEEAAVAHACVATLADALGVHRLDLARTPAGITASIEQVNADPAWTDLLTGRVGAIPTNGATPPGADDVCLLPGSFNPPHEGHSAIAQVAAERTGRAVVYELSIENVDKPPLDFIELRDRLSGLGDQPVWLTRAPTFVEKARLAPGSIFAVGADTIHRIANSRYYETDAARDAAIAELAQLGARFLVFGRQFRDDFDELSDLRLPPSLRALCEGVPEVEFRYDISSTALRAAEDEASGR